MTVNYEELLSSPLKVVKEIIEFCELSPPNNKAGYNAIKDLLPPIKKNTTEKWKNKLSNEDQKKIFEITEPIMKKMNYPYKL